MNYTKCWLDYKPLAKDKIRPCYLNPVLLASGEIAQTIAEEYKTAMSVMLGETVEMSYEVLEEPSVFMQIQKEYEFPDEKGKGHSTEVLNQAFVIYEEEESVVITGRTETAVLQGVFAFLRMVALDNLSEKMPYYCIPSMPFRMMNHWDDMDGSIERGYSGRSFFYDDYKILYNDRTEMYARLMASIGINAIVINNVNVHEKETYLITDVYLKQVKQYTDLFARYGIRLFMSVNFAAPMELSDIPVSDPLDPQVIAWWGKAVAHVYEVIPNFGGFLVKADSEGRPGPFTYGRTHADGANMLAKVLKPYGGTVVWRCFVYNCGLGFSCFCHFLISMFFPISVFYAWQRSKSSSQRRSTSAWNATISSSLPGLNKCLNLPWRFKKSSIGSFFFGS